MQEARPGGGAASGGAHTSAESARHAGEALVHLREVGHVCARQHLRLHDTRFFIRSTTHYGVDAKCPILFSALCATCP